jgi:hypothetical protein
MVFVKLNPNHVWLRISGPTYCVGLCLKAELEFEQRDEFKTKRKSWTQGRRIRKVQQMCLESRQEDKIFRTDRNASWKTSETWTVGPRKTPCLPPSEPIYVCMLIALARWFKNGQVLSVFVNPSGEYNWFHVSVCNDQCKLQPNSWVIYWLIRNSP